MKWSIVLLAALLCSACVTTAGPYVTEVQSLKPDTLSIVKCKVKVTSTPFGTKIEEGECFSENMAMSSFAAPQN